MILKGKELQNIINNSGIPVDEIIKKSKIKRRTFFSLYHKDEVEAHQLEKIRAAGVKMQKSAGVPVYNVDFTAGDMAQFSDEPQRVIGHIDMNGFRRCTSFVQIKGDSMYPKLVAGDLIGVEPITDFKIIQYGYIYGIEINSGERMVKMIRKGKDDDHLILRSFNKDYDDINIHKKEIAKLYKVHGPVRNEWQ